jgi:hypothetical protein
VQTPDPTPRRPAKAGEGHTANVCRQTLR